MNSHEVITERRAQKCISLILCLSYRFIVKINVFKRIINEMQSKLRERFIYRQAKIEILETYWMHFLFKL
jgi:hypothetical protein